MSQIHPPASTVTLKSVKQQFKDWRDTRKHKCRIPDELWEAAISLSGQYSVHYISKSLRINHSVLRDRIVARGIYQNTEGKNLFILMVTARVEEIDRLLGLNWVLMTTDFILNIVSLASTRRKDIAKRLLSNHDLLISEAAMAAPSAPMILGFSGTVT